MRERGGKGLLEIVVLGWKMVSGFSGENDVLKELSSVC